MARFAYTDQALALPRRDQGKADTVGGLILMDQWGAMVGQGDPLA